VFCKINNNEKDIKMRYLSAHGVKSKTTLNNLKKYFTHEHEAKNLKRVLFKLMVCVNCLCLCNNGMGVYV
jgi:tRNA splicing ligase